MKFLRSPCRRSEGAHKLKQQLAWRRRKNYYTRVKKETQDRCSNMGCTFNRESFSKTEPTL